MTRVLGITGSARPWGNSELLVRHALRAARAAGAEVGAVRLAGLRLLACNGCMRCAIGGQPCPLDDDLPWLIDTIQAADALVLAAPIYFLGPAAAIKLVLDRLLMVMGRVDEPIRPLRPALTIATAGLEAWRGVALPFLNAVAGAFGFWAVDSFVALAPGPGEIVLDDAALARAAAAAGRLARGETPAPGSAPVAANACPICRCDSFTLAGRTATCPICGLQGAVEIEDGEVRLRFDATAGPHGRWTPEGLRAHVIEWVQATGPRYLARRDEVKARRAPYRAMELEWLCPPRADKAAGERA